MKNQIKGCIKFSVRGKNLYRFINTLRSERINCSNQYCKNDTYYGEVSVHDFETVRELAGNYRMELDFYEYETARKKLLRHRRRYGIYAGIILTLISVIYFSNTVMTIEIIGNQRVSDTTVIAMLENAGIKKGTFIGGINFSSCERKLRMGNTNISWVGIRHTGNRLVVEMTETVPVPEMENTKTPCNIIASHTAQITAMSIYNGQIMRGVGDYVRKGDVIVSGVVSDGRGHINLRHSYGKVTAIYEDSITIHQDFRENIKKKTGKSFNQKFLNLFNLKIPLFIGKNSFSEYDKDTVSSPFFLFGKELPISLRKDRIYEIKNSEKIYAPEEAKAVIEEKVFIYEKNFLSDVNIINCSLEYSQSDTGIDCIVRYTLEGEIGMKKDIWAK